MGNETNEFGKSLGDSALSNSEEIFSKKLLEKGANLRFKGYSESFKLNPEIAFKNLQKGRIFQKVGNAFGKKILSQLNLFSNIKADYDKTKNIIYSTAKNVTSGLAGKAAGTAVTAAIAIPAAGTDAPLAIASGIATDAAVSTGVNKTFDYGYQNRGKISSQWQKFLNNAKNNDGLYNYSTNQPANLGTSNQPIAGVANNAGVADATQLITTYTPLTNTVNEYGWMAQLGSILSGAATLIGATAGIAGGISAAQNATSASNAVQIGVSNTNSGYINWPSSIKPFHTGGKVEVPKHKGGRNEMIAILQGGETVRTEAQEKELQEAKQKELLEAFAPLVSGESDDNPYAQVFGKQSKKKDPKTPVLMNKTRHDEELIISIIADAWRTNRSGFRNILRYN